MRRTLGYHMVKSAYGQWLPGDERGHWSSAWDDEIRYTEPHKLHVGDSIRERMAAERMKHPAVRFSPTVMAAIAEAVESCAKQSDWTVAAMAIEPTHMHLLLTYTERDIDSTAKWLAQQTTRAVHEKAGHDGPVWCRGKWCSFVFTSMHWQNAMRYVEQHNLRRGLAAHPYPFVTG